MLSIKFALSRAKRNCGLSPSSGRVQARRAQKMKKAEERDPLQTRCFISKIQRDFGFRPAIPINLASLRVKRRASALSARERERQGPP